MAISRRLDGELPAESEARLDEHLARCAGCRAWARGQGEASRRLRSALAIAPGDLEPIARAVLEGAARAAGSPERAPAMASVPGRLIRFARPAAAFAAAMLVGVCLWMGSAWIIRSGGRSPGGPIAKSGGAAEESERPILILEGASREIDLFHDAGGQPAGLETRRQRAIFLPAPEPGSGKGSSPDLMLELEKIDPRYILPANYTWH